MADCILIEPRGAVMYLRMRTEIRVGPVWRVWRGEDQDTRRLFVVKEVAPGAPRADALARELADEFQLLAGVEHPNLLRAVRFDAGAGRAVFGDAQCSLAGYLDRAGPLPPDQVANVLLQAAEGLEQLHARRLGHGAVSLHSLLVGPAGGVLLGDFLGHALGAPGLPTPAPETKYLAPELLSSRAGRWGRSTDLYGLGYAALELLTGPRFDRLFALAPGASLLTWHADTGRELADWRGALPHVPSGLLDIIAGLIPKNPADRAFPCAARLGAAIRQFGLASERGLTPPGPGSAPVAPPVQVRPGGRPTRLGGFALRQVLHAGAGGCVYLARWRERDGRLAAVRVLNRAAVAGPAEVRALAGRLVVAGRVRDRRLVRLYRAGFSSAPGGNVWYAAAEYMPRGSLRCWLAAGHLLSPRAAARMAVRVGRGLVALHAAGLVHGHLDPGGVLFDRSGKANVGDYWLPPPAHPVGGSPYRPPEQQPGSAPDPRWDVYALGAILAESVSPPGATGSETPAWLADLILAATHRDPDRRIPSAAEFVRRLRAALPPRTPA